MPTTRSCGPPNASTAASRSISCASPGSTMAAFPASGRLSPDRHRADANGGEQALRLQTDMLVGHRGRPGSGPPRPARRRDRLLRSGLERRGACPDQRRRGRRSARGDDALLARLARPRGDSRPRAWADDPALGAGDQGPHVHADGGDGRGAHHVAAGDTRRRAELGLPLHLDPRLDLPSTCAALPAPGLGGRRVHAVHGRPRTATTMAASRSCTGSTVAGI